MFSEEQFIKIKLLKIATFMKEDYEKLYLYINIMLKAVNFYFLLAIYTALLFITNSAIINHQSIVVVTQCQSN